MGTVQLQRALRGWTCAGPRSRTDHPAGSHQTRHSRSVEVMPRSTYMVIQIELTDSLLGFVCDTEEAFTSENWIVRAHPAPALTPYTQCSLLTVCKPRLIRRSGSTPSRKKTTWVETIRLRPRSRGASEESGSRRSRPGRPNRNEKRKRGSFESYSRKASNHLSRWWSAAAESRVQIYTLLFSPFAPPAAALLYELERHRLETIASDP